MIYDFLVGDDLPLTNGPSEFMELTGYYPLHLYQEKTSRIPNFVSPGITFSKKIILRNQKSQ
jgi:hypothetical protein